MSHDQRCHQHHADCGYILALLPEDVLAHVLSSGSQRHLFGVVACVCKAWREAVLRTTKSVTMVLKSDTAASSAVLWLQHHAHLLQDLEITTAGLH
jgi:hypothetical protein